MDVESDDEFRVTLLPVASSGIFQSGDATFEEKDGKVLINLDVTDIGVANGQPAHIHIGTCPGLGEIVYPLDNVVNGESETILDTTINQIKKQLPLAINIHKSTNEINMYTSCGEIPQ